MQVHTNVSDSLNVAGSVCGYTARVSTPADVPVVVREAMRMMRSQRPRPAYIEMPLDVQAGEADVMLQTQAQDDRPVGNPDAIARAADALQSAKRPFIYAGGGADSGAAAPLLARLAEALGAPVVTSVFGRGAISDRHPLALGAENLTRGPHLTEHAVSDIVAGATTSRPEAACGSRLSYR